MIQNNPAVESNILLHKTEATVNSTIKAREKHILNVCAQTWFVVASLGLFIFSLYVVIFYGGTGLKGEFSQWNSLAEHGYIEGDSANNIAFAAHALLAVIILIGGPLQLIPKIRTVAPTFHRWNGRVYLATLAIIIFAGLYSSWAHEVRSDINRIAVTINGVLIIWFAYMALKNAINKDFIQHRLWAIRLFIATCGVWFFRIGLMFWVFVHQKPVGFDPETFTGPAIVFLSFSQYLIPLAILEGYFYAQNSTNKILQRSIISILALSILITAVGIFAASMIMWLPKM